MLCGLVVPYEIYYIISMPDLSLQLQNIVWALVTLFAIFGLYAYVNEWAVLPRVTWKVISISFLIFNLWYFLKNIAHFSEDMSSANVAFIVVTEITYLPLMYGILDYAFGKKEYWNDEKQPNKALQSTAYSGD